MKLREVDAANQSCLLFVVGSVQVISEYMAVLSLEFQKQLSMLMFAVANVAVGQLHNQLSKSSACTQEADYF